MQCRVNLVNIRGRENAIICKAECHPPPTMSILEGMKRGEGLKFLSSFTLDPY